MFALLWFAGSLFTTAAFQERERGRRSSGSPGLGDGLTGATADAKILQAQEEFLPYAEVQIDRVRKDAPLDLTDWRSLAGRLPYLTEAVAMYFTMEDPEVPNTAKISIAAALVYTISPLDIVPDEIPFLGQADDAAVLASAIYHVYGYVTQEHIEQAKEWLRSHGVEPKPLFALGKQFPRALPDGSIGVETPSAQD